MATVKLRDETYGWGGEARDLPNDPDAYGPRILDEAESAELMKELRDAGWECFTKTQLEGRAVFLIEPGKWRRPVLIRGLPGQVFQVREIPKADQT